MPRRQRPPKRRRTLGPAPGYVEIEEQEKLAADLGLEPSYRVELELKGILFSPTSNNLFVPASQLNLLRAISRVIGSGIPSNDLAAVLFRVVWNEALEVADPYQFTGLLEEVGEDVLHRDLANGFRLGGKQARHVRRSLPSGSVTNDKGWQSKRRDVQSAGLAVLSVEDRVRAGHERIDGEQLALPHGWWSNRSLLINAFGNDVAQLPADELSIPTQLARIAAVLNELNRSRPWPRQQLMNVILRARDRFWDIVTNSTHPAEVAAKAWHRVLESARTYEDATGQHRVTPELRGRWLLEEDVLSACFLLGALLLPVRPSPATEPLSIALARGWRPKPSQSCLVGGQPHLLQTVLERSAVVIPTDDGNPKVVPIREVGIIPPASSPSDAATPRP